jgi:hypothetical protein
MQQLNTELHFVSFIKAYYQLEFRSTILLVDEDERPRASPNCQLAWLLNQAVLPTGRTTQAAAPEPGLVRPAW